MAGKFARRDRPPRRPGSLGGAVRGTRCGSVRSAGCSLCVARVGSAGPGARLFPPGGLSRALENVDVRGLITHSNGHCCGIWVVFAEFPGVEDFFRLMYRTGALLVAYPSVRS